MPMQSYRVKDSEKPWVSNAIRELTKKKQRVFRQMGFKSAEYKRLKKAIEKSYECRKEVFL